MSYTFIIFIIAASLFPTLQRPGTPIKVFQFLYFFSSFWVQFGPNSTVFLVAAPTVEEEPAALEAAPTQPEVIKEKKEEPAPAPEKK